MCKHCIKNDFVKTEIRLKGKTFVPIGDGWGFHNLSVIVRDERDGVFRIFKDDIVTQPIEYCPKCGRKLDGRSE